MMRVIPGKGRRVRDPANGQLLPVRKPTTVPSSPYWLRRFADGDVVAPPPPSAPKPETSTARKDQA